MKNRSPWFCLFLFLGKAYSAVSAVTLDIYYTCVLWNNMHILILVNDFILYIIYWLSSTEGVQSCLFYLPWASLVAQRIKHVPAMWEISVRSLGREDPVEKEMAIHSSILTWESHGQWSLVDSSPWGPKELDTTEHFFFSYLLHLPLNYFPACDFMYSTTLA